MRCSIKIVYAAFACVGAISLPGFTTESIAQSVVRTPVRPDVGTVARIPTQAKVRPLSPQLPGIAAQTAQPVATGPRPGVVAAVANSRITVNGSSPLGSQTVTYPSLIGPVALSSFKLSFPDSLGSLWRIGAMASANTEGLVSLYDGNEGGAPRRFDYDVTWIRIPGATPGSVFLTSPCTNCFLTIPPGPSGTKLVLSGFSATLRGPTNFNNFTIMASEDDNVAPFLRGFRVSIAGTSVQVGGQAPVFETVEIYYSWIPAENVAATYHLTTDNPESLKDWSNIPNVALQGFSLGYYDGVGRRFSAIGVHPDLSGRDPQNKPQAHTLTGEGVTPGTSRTRGDMYMESKVLVLR